MPSKPTATAPVPSAGPEYFEEAGALYRNTPSGPRRLANFTCTITGEVVEDGHRWLTLATRLDGQSRTIRLTAPMFATMSWVLSELGARAIVDVPAKVLTRAIQTVSLAVLSPPTSRSVRAENSPKSATLSKARRPGDGRPRPPSAA